MPAGTESRKELFTRSGSPFPPVNERTAKIVWRDFLFLVIGAIALSIISYVETHASDESARFSGGRVMDSKEANPMGIVDTGFILTGRFHAFLKESQRTCDWMAAINSVTLLMPTVYTTYITVWVGDFSLVFRIIAAQLLRSFCGWFTYLPPDPSYLTSYYDFPDIVQCLFQDCSGAPEAMPFVSFFSGHVAMMVIAGNHMWMQGFTTWSIIVHVCNAFQTVRLLATRGHYSIDIIIAWYVAVQISNSAARLGRYYSRGASMREVMPANATEVFETVTGVGRARTDARMSKLMQRDEFKELLKQVQDDDMTPEEQSETTARLIHEQLSDQVHEHMQRLYDIDPLKKKKT